MQPRTCTSGILRLNMSGGTTWGTSRGPGSLAKLGIIKGYEIFRVLSHCGRRCWGCSCPFLSFRRGGWAWGRGGRVPLVRGGACRRAGVGAATWCVRSRIDASRSATAWGVCWSFVRRRFASCEETSWSSSLMGSFSWKIVATFVLPHSAHVRW